VPGHLRLRWSEIDRFERTQGIGSTVSTVSVARRGRRRRTSLTPYPITSARAQVMVDGLNARLSAS
jgi:hypothetical protein